MMPTLQHPTNDALSVIYFVGRVPLTCGRVLRAVATRREARQQTPALLEAVLTRRHIARAEIWAPSARDDGKAEVVVYLQRRAQPAEVIAELGSATGLSFRRCRWRVRARKPVVETVSVVETVPAVETVVAVPVVETSPKPVVETTQRTRKRTRKPVVEETDSEPEPELVARPAQQLVPVDPDPAVVDRVRRALPVLRARRYAASVWLVEELRDAVGIEVDQTSQMAAALAVLADEGVVARTRPGFYRLSPKSTSSTAKS